MTLLSQFFAVVVIAECLVLCGILLWRLRNFPERPAALWVVLAFSWYTTVIQIQGLLPDPSLFVKTGIASRLGTALILATLIVLYGRRRHDAA